MNRKTTRLPLAGAQTTKASRVTKELTTYLRIQSANAEPNSAQENTYSLDAPSPYAQDTGTCWATASRHDTNISRTTNTGSRSCPTFDKRIPRNKMRHGTESQEFTQPT